MKKFLPLLLIVAFGACAGGGERPAQNTLKYRWVYMSRNLSQDKHVEEIRALADTCAANGLNGILLSAGMDQLDLANNDYIRRLFEVREISQKTGVEIIPAIYSVGYGGGIMAHNKNLAAGMPVNDALYVAGKGKATFQPDPAVEVPNGGFEQLDGELPAGFDAGESAGKTVFADQEKSHSSSASLRFQDLSAAASDAAVSVEIAVTPNRLYRMSAWIMTEGQGEENPFGGQNIKLQATASDGRPLEWINLRTSDEPGWKQDIEAFNSKSYDKVRISVEVEKGTQGTVWIDDLVVEEIGMVNLLRRPGTPIEVRDDATGKIYEEGKDFAALEDTILDFRFDHDGPEIELLPGGAIKPGAKLRVSFYHGIYNYNSQVTICMSEPEVYEIWKDNARRIQDILHNDKYFLVMDEVRNGGSCKACQERHMTMGQIMGDAITQATNIVRWARPDAEVFIWSDMIDPNHNARDNRPYYYYVDQNFSGSWNYIPKDLNIVCWWYEKRDDCLKFFSEADYRTVGAAYYDADDLENPKGWLESLSHTPHAEGIMYTTWLNKYDLLDDFGDLVNSYEMKK